MPAVRPLGGPAQEAGHERQDVHACPRSPGMQAGSCGLAVRVSWRQPSAAYRQHLHAPLKCLYRQAGWHAPAGAQPGQLCGTWSRAAYAPRAAHAAGTRCRPARSTATLPGAHWQLGGCVMQPHKPGRQWNGAQVCGQCSSMQASRLSCVQAGQLPAESRAAGSCGPGHAPRGRTAAWSRGLHH